MDSGGRAQGQRNYFGACEPAENTDHQLLLSVTAEVSFEETALQTWGLGSPSCAQDAAEDTTQTFEEKITVAGNKKWESSLGINSSMLTMSLAYILFKFQV